MLSKNKKYLVFAIIFTAVSAGGLSAYFLPRAVVSNPSDTRIQFVSCGDTDAASFDERAIIDVLSEYEYRGSMKKFFPAGDPSKTRIEIDGLDFQGPMHIEIRDDVSVYYHSADQTVYEIIDEDGDLKDKILPYISVDQPGN